MYQNDCHLQSATSILSIVHGHHPGQATVNQADVIKLLPMVQFCTYLKCTGSNKILHVGMCLLLLCNQESSQESVHVMEAVIFILKNR